MRFSRRSGRISGKADTVEVDVLSSLAADLLVLLGEQDEADTDPLAALVGLSSGPVTRPRTRRWPGCCRTRYGDDREAAEEFRRYTEGDLRAASGPAPGPCWRPGAADRAGRPARAADREQADAWLGCLNDLRLVLGTRLDVTEDTDLDPAADDPARQALHVYGWLGWLQESLLGCLDPVRAAVVRPRSLGCRRAGAARRRWSTASSHTPAATTPTSAAA
jgi:hypothetical protein